MKKKVLAVLMAAAMAAGLVACGNSDAAGETAEPAAETEEEAAETEEAAAGAETVIITARRPDREVIEEEGAVTAETAIMQPCASKQKSRRNYRTSSWPCSFNHLRAER